MARRTGQLHLPLGRTWQTTTAMDRMVAPAS